MLDGAEVSLRAPRDDDWQHLTDMRNDLELQQALMALPRPNTSERTKEWVNRLIAEGSAFFVIADRDGGAFQGFVQLTRIAQVHGHGEVGIALLPGARGKGHGPEALDLLADYARSTFNLRKFVLQVLAGNEAAIRAYERAGFRTVGTLRQHVYSGGAHHDVVVMERLL
jgi:RimJ/RimL family protein N-acetyltransferase